MKKISVLVILITCTSFVFAQSKNSSRLEGLVKIEGGLQGIGIGIEPRLTDKISMDAGAGFGGGYDIAEGFISYSFVLDNPAFYFYANPKYFYNRHKRSSTGRTGELNAGNYIGARIKFSTPVDTRTDIIRSSLLINLHWGIQRPISRKWLFNAHAGLGYAEDVKYVFGTIYPALDFKFSYVIGKFR